MTFAIPSTPLVCLVLSLVIFQANLSGPPSESSEVFSDPPFWVLSYD